MLGALSYHTHTTRAKAMPSVASATWGKGSATRRAAACSRTSSRSTATGAFCSGQCGSVTGCQGFNYWPSGGDCRLFGSSFTASSSGMPAGFTFSSGSGRGLITQVDGYPGFFCYQHTAGNIPGTCTAPSSPAPHCVGTRWPPCTSP